MNLDAENQKYLSVMDKFIEIYRITHNNCENLTKIVYKYSYKFYRSDQNKIHDINLIYIYI
jgi:hypothetical protein